MDSITEKDFRDGIRPWGRFITLEDRETYKVKRVEVLPGQRLSYQKHTRRSEHWVIVSGNCRITLDEDVVDLCTGEAIDIPLGAAHRIANPGSELLIFIEVQRGDYFGEDDIIRLEDDYGRSEKD